MNKKQGPAKAMIAAGRQGGKPFFTWAVIKALFQAPVIDKSIIPLIHFSMQPRDLHHSQIRPNTEEEFQEVLKLLVKAGYKSRDEENYPLADTSWIEFQGVPNSVLSICYMPGKEPDNSVSAGGKPSDLKQFTGEKAISILKNAISKNYRRSWKVNSEQRIGFMAKKKAQVVSADSDDGMRVEKTPEGYKVSGPAYMKTPMEVKTFSLVFESIEEMRAHINQMAAAEKVIKHHLS